LEVIFWKIQMPPSRDDDADIDDPNSLCNDAASVVSYPYLKDKKLAYRRLYILRNLSQTFIKK
jgi:hypothetical protein